MEDYAAKMAGKTDAELQQYVQHRAEYIDAAVLAALTELERRGQVIPDAATLRAELESAVQSAVPVTTEAPPWARPVEEVEEDAEEAADLPALYTPMTVAVYSICLPFVGGILMLLNLLRLRRYGGAALLMALVVAVVSTSSWVWNQFHPPLLVFLAVTSFVLAAIYIYLLWPYFIGKQDYRPRSWLNPLLVLLALQFLLAAIVSMLGVSGLPGAGQ